MLTLSRKPKEDDFFGIADSNMTEIPFDLPEPVHISI
jgi:hypothetical protein